MLILIACEEAPDSKREVLLDERTAGLAERVAEQARDQHADDLGVYWESVADDWPDQDKPPDDLLATIDPPEGVEAVDVQMRRWNISTPDDGGRFSLSRPAVVRPEDGESFCAVVAVADDGEFAGVPAMGDLKEDCHQPSIQPNDEPLLIGWPVGDW